MGPPDNAKIGGEPLNATDTTGTELLDPKRHGPKCPVFACNDHAPPRPALLAPHGPNRRLPFVYLSL